MDERFNGVISPSPSDPGVLEAYLRPLYAPDSHAANLLELDNGDLLCVWFNGSGEGNPDTNVVMSRLPYGASRWEDPVELANHPERSEQNPVLFQAPDGKVWLLHTSGEPHDQSSARVVRRISEDRGRTWGPPTVLFEGPGLFLRHPIVVLKNGDWLLPAYYCKSGGHYSVVLISPDQGRSWQEMEVPGSVHRVHMNIVERSDGSLLAMFRSRHADRIYVSTSHDGGRTWTPPERSGLPNNNSSFQVIRLRSGSLALVYNNVTMERDQFRWVGEEGSPRKKPLRTPLTLAISEDEGKSWPFVKNLQTADLEYKEKPVGYSYPSIVQSRDGALHIAFSYLRKTIKYVRVSEAWVKEGHVGGLVS